MTPKYKRADIVCELVLFYFSNYWLIFLAVWCNFPGDPLKYFNRSVISSTLKMSALFSHASISDKKVEFMSIYPLIRHKNCHPLNPPAWKSGSRKTQKKYFLSSRNISDLWRHKIEFPMIFFFIKNIGWMLTQKDET